MKKSLKPAVYILLILFAAAAFSSAAKSLWVTSAGADLKEKPSISSRTITELARGAELTEQEHESRWYLVETREGLTGWVYRGKVSESPPVSEEGSSEEEGGVGDLLGGLSGSSVEADAADSARSIRGLSPEAKAYAEKTGTPEQSRKALDQLLSISVPKDSIERFLEKGNVGEYAE